MAGTENRWKNVKPRLNQRMTGGKKKKNGGVVLRDAFCIRTIDCNDFCIQIKMGLTAMPFAIRQSKGSKEYSRMRRCDHYVEDIRKTNGVDSNVLNIPEGKCQVFH